MGNQNAVFVGLATLDLSYAVDRYPLEDTKTRAEGLFLGAGGPAANAAITHAFLSNRRTAAVRDTTLVTALGRHALAQTIRADLRKQGVGVRDTTPDDPSRPPVSSIVVARETGTRTIVSMDGSERDPVPPDQAGYLDWADIVLVDGHYPGLALQAARRAGGDIPVVLDGGRWREDVHRKLLPDITVAICSETFAPEELSASSTDEVIDFLHAAGPEFVAITRGDLPIRYSTPAGRGEIPVAGGDIVDTLGAGDILHGAFCYFFALGEDFPLALRHAAEVATLSCRFVGTREWMRHYDSRSIG